MSARPIWIALVLAAQTSFAFESIAPYLDDREATARGKELGIGTAALEGPTQVEVLSLQTLTVVYTASERGLPSGGGIRIALRHVHNWTRPQVSEPKGPGYLTASTSNDASVAITIGGKAWFSQYHPWQNIVEFRLPEEGIGPGETLSVTFGDNSGGGPGIRVQPFDETDFTFKVYADVLANGEYLPLEQNPSLEVVASKPYRFNSVTPSNAVRGEPTWAIVRAEDRFGNPAPTFRGTVRFSSNGENDALPDDYTFTEEDGGVRRFKGIVFRDIGTATLEITEGTFSTVTNPVLVSETRSDPLLLWGDLHGHTLFSDGRGTVEQFYDFAENFSGLDFCAVTDHAFEIVDWMWEHSKKATEAAHKPGKFVTFQAYEWSGKSDVGGDHNFFFLEEDPPLYRSRSYYDYRNFQMYHGDSPQVNHIEDMYITLEQAIADENVFCVPHYGGRPGNPSFHNPRIQRMIEVFSEHRRSEDWMTPFLVNRCRLGIIASTDGHYGNPGYGYLKEVRDWDTQEIGMAAVAVYAKERTRESIFRALYDRHVYATSGERIVLRFDADGHPMGSELEAGRAPKLEIEATGTAPIHLVQIKKNSKVVHSENPGTVSISLEWIDPEFDPEAETYYYIRILQEDGEEAISSPVWVN